jgi:hypothetical protein
MIMKTILAFFIFTVLVATVGFAQSNQTESLTITTYYPSPHGVYTNLRLMPSDEPDPANLPANPAGTLYFNRTEQRPYVHNGSNWNLIGSGGANFASGQVNPGGCYGNVSAETYNKDQLCDQPWFEDITFSEPLVGTVHVMVFLNAVSDWSGSNCTHNSTDLYIGYPAFLPFQTTYNKGFRLWASGSPPYSLGGVTSSNCSQGTPGEYDDWFSRATASWFAISE